VTDVREYAWGYYPVGSRLYTVFPLSVALGLLLSIIVLFSVVRTSPYPRKRQQAKLWIAGAVIAGPLAMTNLIATFGVPFYPLGNFANVAYAMFIAYAISRHRLMDVDLVVTKSIAYAFLGLLVLLPILGVIIVLQQHFFGSVDYDFSFFVFFVIYHL